MRAAIGIGLALAGAIPAPEVAQATIPPATVQMSSETARLRAATDLVEVIFAAQDVRGQVEMLADGVLTQMAASDISTKAFLEKHPKLLGDLKQAWVPLILRNSAIVQPRMIDEIAQLYAANLSAEDLREVATFFRSPIGQRMLKSVQSNMKYTNATSEIVNGALSDGPDVPDVSRASLEGDRRSAVNNTMAVMSASDRQALDAAAQRPAMQKMIALRAQRSAIDVKWFNATDPDIEKEMEKVTKDLFAKYAKAQ